MAQKARANLKMMTKIAIGISLAVAFLMWIWQYGEAITDWRHSIWNPFDQ